MSARYLAQRPCAVLSPFCATSLPAGCSFRPGARGLWRAGTAIEGRSLSASGWPRHTHYCRPPPAGALRSLGVRGPAGGPRREKFGAGV
jgi:hypothetical protein